MFLVFEAGSLQPCLRGKYSISRLNEFNHSLKIYPELTLVYLNVEILPFTPLSLFSPA